MTGVEFPGFENLPALADWSVAMLAGYGLSAAGGDLLQKAKDAASKAVLAKLSGKAGEVWKWLKEQLGGDSVAGQVLDSFEQDPGQRQNDLANELKRRFEFETGFLDTLRPMLQELRELHSQLPAEIRSTTMSQVVGDVGSQATVIQIQENKPNT